MNNRADAPARHDLLIVAPSDWAAVAATRAPLPPLSNEAAALLAQWGQAGWPVIVRRSLPGEPPGTLPVGLPLPPFVGKARVALRLPAGIEARRISAVPLHVARTMAPARWHKSIDAALTLGRGLGLVPNVFGALLWQSLTGLRYLHATSDLDLLWPVTDGAAIDALLDGLVRLDESGPMRIDGEIVTPKGAVNWRELAAARQRDVDIVLMKSLKQARFVRFDEFRARNGSLCP